MYQRDILLDRALLAGLDATAVFACTVAALWLRHAAGVGGPASTVPWSAYVVPAVLLAAVLVVLLAANGLYRPWHSRFRELIRITKVTGSATAAVLALSFFYRGYVYSRASVVIFFVLSVPLLVGTRALHRSYRGRLRAGHDTGRRVAIVGLGSTGKRLGDALLDEPAYYALMGFIRDGGEPSNGADLGARILGSAEHLQEIVQVHDIDEILLANSDASIEHQQELIGACMAIGVRWRLVPNLAGLLHERVEIDSMGGLPVVGLRGSRVVGYNWILKRSFDLVAATVSGLLLSPLMIVIAVAIKLTSPGPVLYRQTRVGFQGRSFTLLKFRTMRTDSVAAVHERYTADWIFGKTGTLPVSPEVQPGETRNGNGAETWNGDRSSVHKILDDPRVTTVGRLLRASSLDELPQLWNVLRGEMSLVGPRPPLPYEVEHYTEAHKRRFEALPGITGLWQVSGRNQLSFDEMVRLDIAYIENWSLPEDLRIVLRTIPAIVTDRGH